MRSGAPTAALPALLLLLLLLPAPAAVQRASELPGAGPGGGHRHRHWSYSDKAKWASDFSSCGGRMQSPINIHTADTHLSPLLEPLLLTGYNLPPGEELFLHNNGHTIVLDLPGNMTLAGGGLPQPYRAVQLHLHWGSTSGAPGSEHTVDGHRFAGERVVGLWNSLPQDVVMASGLNAFKKIGQFPSGKDHCHEGCVQGPIAGGVFTWSITTPASAALRRLRVSLEAWQCWLHFSRWGLRRTSTISTSWIIWVTSMRKARRPPLQALTLPGCFQTTWSATSVTRAR